MAEKEIMRIGILMVGDNGIQIRAGTSVTRAAVLAETEDGVNNPPIGSKYMSTDREYRRVAAANAETDWQKVTTSAAD